VDSLCDDAGDVLYGELMTAGALPAEQQAANV
jgi:hypothetical protein